MKRLVLALAVVFAVAGLSACNKPAPDVGPAQAAFDAAKAAGVDVANPDMKTADDSLNNAKAEIDKQKKKPLGLFQDYKSARDMLAAAQSSAEKALNDKKAADEAAAKKKAEDEAAAKAAAMKKGGKKGGMKKKM